MGQSVEGKIIYCYLECLGTLRRASDKIQGIVESKKRKGEGVGGGGWVEGREGKKGGNIYNTFHYKDKF